MEGLVVTMIGSTGLPYLWSLFTRREWSKTVTGVFILTMTVLAAAIKELAFGNLSLSVFNPESFFASLGVILVTSQAIYGLFKDSIQKVEGAAETIRSEGSSARKSTKEQLLDGLGALAKERAAVEVARLIDKTTSKKPVDEPSEEQIEAVIEKNYDVLIKLQEEGRFDEMIDVLLDEEAELEELIAANSDEEPEVFDEYERLAG